MNDLKELVNWRRIDARITTSGQPAQAQLASLARLGVSRVINLGLHSHERALADEKGDVTRLGMTYVHIPVDFAAPMPEDFAAFRAALEASAPDKVHVHCIFNWRVSAFFYVYQCTVLGMPEALARQQLYEVWRPDQVWAAFIAGMTGHRHGGD